MQYIVLNGFCPWVHGGCTAWSRGWGRFQCGEDVYPSSHAQRTIEILQLHVRVYTHTHLLWRIIKGIYRYRYRLYCNPGWKVHVIKGFCLWAFWDLELWLDEVYTGGSLGYVDLRHSSQPPCIDNSRYLTAFLVTYSCLMMILWGRNTWHFTKAHIMLTIFDSCVDSNETSPLKKHVAQW